MREIERLGEQLLAACRDAERSLLLCAPFVKKAVLERLLDAARNDVVVEVFTRWRPDEVAAGVSDTAILSLVRDRGGALFLCDRLHAKYFRWDDRALIGSANLTATALGWTASPNLELLTEVSVTTPQLVELEAQLRSEAVPATPEIADEVDRIAALLPRTVEVEPPAAVPSDADAGPWYPQLREPRDLYVAYSIGLDRLSRASAIAASADLAALQLPTGLTREQFEELVGNRLLQSPVVQRVDELLADSQRFGAVRQLMGDLLGLDREGADHAWQTLMRWLLEFMPHRYDRSVPRWSEVLVRRGGEPEV